MNTTITGDESWEYGYVPETKSFRHFPYNENPTTVLNNTSLECYLPSTDAIERREKNSSMPMKAEGRLMQARFIEIHQEFYNNKNKIGYFSNRPRIHTWKCSTIIGG